MRAHKGWRPPSGDSHLPRMDECSRTRARAGFTLIELTIVMLLVAGVMTMAVASLGSIRGRSAARGAAQHFATDLRQARAFARRSNEPVTITFDETADALRYIVVGASGDTLVDRRFQSESDIRLDSFDLQTPGNTLRFEADGIASLDAVELSAPTATARFVAGGVTYVVRFNATGEGRVEAG